MRPSLHVRILAGFLIGSVTGILSHALLGESPRLEWWVAQVTEPLGKGFLRLLLCMVVPLVVSSLVLGVMGLGDLRQLGRVGLKTLLFTLLVSGVAVIIGLGVAAQVRPGERLTPEIRASLQERYGEKAQEVAKAGRQEAKSPLQVVVEVLPDNPLAAMTRSPPDMLGVMAISLLFGAALASLSEARSRGLVAALSGVFEAVSAFIHGVMRLAPYGVFCLMFTMTARFGWELLVSLGAFVLCVLLSLAFHQVVVYSVLLRALGRVSPREFFHRSREVMLTAFSTSSSNATLPTALRVCEETLKVPRSISAFVLTVGATANQNGTALFEGLAVLFLAQVFGVELTLAQQGTVMVLAVVSGIGTAGIPSGSLPFIAMVLATVGVPPEGIAILLGVDRLLDMCRTVVNVTGDLACAVVVARSEGMPPWSTEGPEVGETR